MAPRVSVIIPNWNGCHHLDDCLTALRGQRFGDFESIIVDNGSTDHSVAHVTANFPEVRVLPLGSNRGFTGAGNAGFAAARGEIIVLLNNDTAVAPGWLAAIVDAFTRRPDVGIVASKIMLFDRRDHFHTAGDYYRVDGVPGNRGVWQVDEGQFDREEEVFSACGGAAAYRRSMLEATGFLDDVFFFSGEDVDLAWRAQLAGWRVLYVPTAVVYHKLKASGGSGATSSYYDGRNFLYVIAKNYPTGLLRRHWRDIVRAQWRLAREALGAWRGAAARARLKGQLVGLLTWPRLLPARWRIQQRRCLADETVAERLQS